MGDARTREIRNVIEPPPDNLPHIEQGITYHLEEAARLRDAGARLAAEQGWAEPDIVAWLIAHGADHAEARELAAGALVARDEARELAATVVRGRLVQDPREDM